jgi:uncharacterized protein (DUF488 family)
MAISDERIEAQCNSDGRIIYTIGYEGRSLEDFSNELMSNGIKRLVDVREIAQSRKPGFSSKRMSQDLPDKGIEYLHIKSLGSPKAMRDELKQTGDFGKFADAYGKHLEFQAESLDALLRNAIEKPTALMCYERESTRCHRSIIASRLAGLGFAIVNL